MMIRKIAKCLARCIRRLLANLFVHIQSVLHFGDEAINVVKSLSRLGLLLTILAITLLSRASKKLCSTFIGDNLFLFSKPASERKHRKVHVKSKNERRYFTVSEYYRNVLAFPLKPVENGSSGGGNEQSEAVRSSGQSQAGNSGMQSRGGGSGEESRAVSSGMQSRGVGSGEETRAVSSSGQPPAESTGMQSLGGESGEESRAVICGMQSQTGSGCSHPQAWRRAMISFILSRMVQFSQKKGKKKLSARKIKEKEFAREKRERERRWAMAIRELTGSKRRKGRQAGISSGHPQAGSSGMQVQVCRSCMHPQAWRSAMISLLLRNNVPITRGEVELIQLAGWQVERGPSAKQTKREHARVRAEIKQGWAMLLAESGRSRAVAGSSGARAQVGHVERLDADGCSTSASGGQARAETGGMFDRDWFPAYIGRVTVFRRHSDAFMTLLRNWREEEIRKRSQAEAASSERMDEDYPSSSSKREESGDVSNQVINDRNLESELIQIENDLVQIASSWFELEADFGARCAESIFFLLRAIREVHIRIRSGGPTGYSLSMISRLRACLTLYAEIYPGVTIFLRDCLMNDNMIPFVTRDERRLVPLTESEVHSLRGKRMDQSTNAWAVTLFPVSIPCPPVPPEASRFPPCVADQPSTSQEAAEHGQKTAEEDKSLEDPEISNKGISGSRSGGSGAQSQVGTSSGQPQDGSSGMLSQARDGRKPLQSWRKEMLSLLLRNNSLITREEEADIQRPEETTERESAMARAEIERGWAMVAEKERARAKEERDLAQAVAGSSGAQAQVVHVERMDADDSSSSGSGGHAEARVEGRMFEGEDSSSDVSERPVLRMSRDTFMNFLRCWREDEIRKRGQAEAVSSESTDEDDSPSSSNKVEGSDVSNLVLCDQILECNLNQLLKDLKTISYWRLARGSDFDDGRCRERIFFLLRAIREVHLRIGTAGPTGYNPHIVSRLIDCLALYSELYPEVRGFFTDCLVDDHLIPVVTSDVPRLVPLTENEAISLTYQLPHSTCAYFVPLVPVPISSPPVQPEAPGSVPCFADRPSTSQGSAAYGQRTAEEDKNLGERSFQKHSGTTSARPTAVKFVLGDDPYLRSSSIEESVIASAGVSVVVSLQSSSSSEEDVIASAGVSEDVPPQSSSSSEKDVTATGSVPEEHPLPSSASSEQEVVATGSVPEDVPLQSSSSSEEDVTASGSVKRRLRQTAGQKTRKHTYEEQYATPSATHADIVGTKHAQQQVTLEGEIPGPSEERKGTTDESVQHMASDDDGKDSDAPDSRPQSVMDAASLTEEPGHVSPRQEVQSSAQEESESQSAMGEESQLQPKRASPE